jgi:hypothetical protein
MAMLSILSHFLFCDCSAGLPGIAGHKNTRQSQILESSMSLGPPQPVAFILREECGAIVCWLHN